MKKGIVFLTAAALLVSMAMPVSAAEQITTFKGDQELVLTEAGDVDLTMEELIEKAQTRMADVDDIALNMIMDVEATMAMEVEGTEMTMDLAVRADMTDEKKGDVEYKAEKMNMSYFGMEMKEETEEYIFPNASGKKVSVKKETASESEDEDNGIWVAEAAEDDFEDADDEMDDLESDMEDTSSLDSVVSDDLFESFALLGKMYTDGEKNYYVLEGDMSEVMGNSFGDVEEMFGGVASDAPCYLLFAEDGMMESLHMDLGAAGASIAGEEGLETTFSKFLISMYTEEAAEIEIPADVQAAGDEVA